MNRKELKYRAKAQLNGNWWPIILATLIVNLIIALPVFFVSYRSVVDTIMTILPNNVMGNFQGAAALSNMVPSLIVTAYTIIVTGPLSIGLCKFMIMFVRRGDTEIGTIFDGFKIFGSAFVIMLLMEIFVFLWSLLLIIPGFIMTYAYSAAFYIKAANPEMGAMECIKKSREIMRGHKWEMFVIDLSFIGWVILAALTAGIGNIWLIPYINTTKANFYVLLMRENNLDGKIIENEEGQEVSPYIDEE